MMHVRTMVLMLAVTMVGCGWLHKAEEPKPEPKPTKDSLYWRLGGEGAISQVVSNFIDKLLTDKTIMANKVVAERTKEADAGKLKMLVTAMLCQAAGGPQKYGGRGMVEVHTGMNITEAEWQQMMVLLTEVATEMKLPAQEAGEVVDIIDSTKDDIVGK